MNISIKSGKFLKHVLIIFLLIGMFMPGIAQDPGQDTAAKRPKVGLVLSGGGAKGFAYIGLLRAFEEAGLPVDYIGGSSIGSIIGGLYAIGYHPDTIAKLIRSQNWDNLLKDIPDRKFISFEDKEFGENTIVTLPFKNKKLDIASMYKGQEINLLLNRYYSPVSQVNDFNKFPIPFLCIGTNLLTGEQVVIRSGYLPMAVRASMSIPGYFSPTEYGGKYLVDGGVVNNYPALEVKKMGAEILVGGDVQSGKVKTREDMNSIPAIFEQITSFSRKRANEIGDSLTDLKIRIRMPYSVMEFNKFDSIIAIGEKVAKSHLPAIKALADSLNRISFKPMPPRLTTPLEKIRVDSVVVRGNRKMSDTYFHSIFSGYENKEISLEELQRDIRLTYGSGFFESLTYSFEKEGENHNLVIDVTEAGPGAASAGVHYDSDYGICLTLSGTFRNLLGSNSKLLTDINVAVNPRLWAVYLNGIGGKASVGGSLEFFTFLVDLFDQSVKVNKINLTNYKATPFFNYSFRNLVNMRIGFDYEYFRFRQDILIDTTLKPMETFSGYGTLFFSLAADTRDKSWYTTRGVLAGVRVEYVMPLSKNWSGELFTNSPIIYGNYDHFFKIGNKLVVQPGTFFGATLQTGAIPPVHHTFGMGGQTPENYLKTIVPFAGLHFIQNFGYYSLIGRMKLNYNIYNKLYLSLKADLGANQDMFNQLFKPENTMFGYGATFSYNSFIGPLELSFLGSNMNPGVMVYLNLGWWF
jgi:NTE family protein